MTEPVLQGKTLEDWTSRLADLDATTRQNACTTLGKSGGRSLIGTTVVPAMHKLLSDPSPEVANHAMWALSRIADPRSVDPIIARLSTSPELRGGSGIANIRSWEEQAENFGRPDSGESLLVIYGLSALANIGDHRAEPFIRSLIAPSIPKRGAANEALVRMGFPSSYSTPATSSGCMALIVSLAGFAFIMWLAG